MDFWCWFGRTSPGPSGAFPLQRGNRAGRRRLLGVVFIEHRTSNIEYRILLVILLGLTAAACFGYAFGSGFNFFLLITGFRDDTFFGEPCAVAVSDRAGNLYVADSKFGTVDVFSVLGMPVEQYGRGCGLSAPIGVGVGKDGRVWVSEKGSPALRVIDKEGASSSFDVPVPEGDSDPQPGRMDFDRDGNLYLVDEANCRICVFDKDGNLKLRVGGKGFKRGEFEKLRDVAVDETGRIYALSDSGTPVQVFDKKGKYIFRFGFQGDGPEDIAVPAGLFVDRNFQVWIVDRGQHCLKVFDGRSGEYLRTFGYYGVNEGELAQPVDAAMDSSGRIYIAEAGTRRVQIFSLDNPFEPFKPNGL